VDLPAELAAHPAWFVCVEVDALLPPWDVPPAVFAAYLEDLTDEGEAEAVEPWADPATGWFDADDADAWELLHRSFAAVVTQLDADLGPVLEALDAVTIVTADAGFPLGEHGVLGPHRPWLHEEVVHLPLLVRFPDRRFAGTRVNALTQPADLTPTLLGLFGVPIPPGVTGHDLAALWQGGEGDRPHAISVLTTNGATEAAIRTDGWAYLSPGGQPAEDADEPRTAKLFVKPDDRTEVNDVAAREVEAAERLEAELRQALQ
jgi:arylsulfatase A-like enzyme